MSVSFITSFFPRFFLYWISSIKILLGEQNAEAIKEKRHYSTNGVVDK